MEDVRIRPETPADHPAVEEVNRRAFGGDEEVTLVQALRDDPSYVPELSLVAEAEGRIVGYILFTRMAIGEGEAEALSLAPVAVLPGFQRQGVGTALVREGIEAARRLGFSIIIVLGHPDYYPRFGFVPAAPFGITAPWPVPEEVFMVLGLEEGAFEGVQGTVRFPPAFDAAV